jgi:hypothetical protein
MPTSTSTPPVTPATATGLGNAALEGVPPAPATPSAPTPAPATPSAPTPAPATPEAAALGQAAALGGVDSRAPPARRSATLPTGGADPAAEGWSAAARPGTGAEADPDAEAEAAGSGVAWGALA